MDEDFAEADADLQESRTVREDWCRRNMEEISAAVTRGATGVEASYFLDQGVLQSYASTFDE